MCACAGRYSDVVADWTTPLQPEMRHRCRDMRSRRGNDRYRCAGRHQALHWRRLGETQSNINHDSSAIYTLRWLIKSSHIVDVTRAVARIFIQRGIPLPFPSPSFSFPPSPCSFLPLPSPLALPSPLSPPFATIQLRGPGERFKLPNGPRHTNDFLANLEHKIKHLTTTILTIN